METDEIDAALDAPLERNAGPRAHAATGDLPAAQYLLGHTSPRMTDRHTLGAVPERLNVAVRQIDGFQAGSCGEAEAVRGGRTGPTLVSS
jgi:integrase